MESVLSKQQQHSKLLKGLYRPQMQTLLSRYTARFFRPAVSKVLDHSHMKEAISAALTATTAPFTAEQVADTLASHCDERNDDCHINTDARLKQDMKAMVDDGVVELLSADMPVECHIVSNYKTYLQLLPGFNA